MWTIAVLGWEGFLVDEGVIVPVVVTISGNEKFSIEFVVFGCFGVVVGTYVVGTVISEAVAV